MKEKQLEQFVDHLEMAVNDIVEQSRVRNPRRPLPKEVMPEAMHMMNALLEGMSEAEYAAQYPERYARIRAAVRPEEVLVPSQQPRLTGRSRQHTS